MLLELIHQTGIVPKKASQAVYHSACPWCGGKDRFTIWGEENRYWCRQCQRSGDTIQFLRDFHGMSFPQAAEVVGKPVERFRSSFNSSPAQQEKSKPLHQWMPHPAELPSVTWCQTAERFLNSTKKKLPTNLEAIHFLQAQKGLTLTTIQTTEFGYNPKDRYARPKTWGLEGSKRFWIPAGLVIPYRKEGQIIKIRIRRFVTEEPRYVAIKGTGTLPSWYGRNPQHVVLVESDLDAILLAQEAGDLALYVALGSATYRPDIETMGLLQQAQRVFLALDVDEAGKRETQTWWAKHFPYAQPLSIQSGKDPSDAWGHGISLRDWVLQGIRNTHDAG